MLESLSKQQLQSIKLLNVLQYLRILIVEKKKHDEQIFENNLMPKLIASLSARAVDNKLLGVIS